MQTFRAGGKGGQNQNKTNSGVRIIHRASGAVGEGREFREQSRNRKAAFERCVKSQKFQTWLKMQVSGQVALEDRVEKDLTSDDLLIEVRKNGKWVRSDGL